MPSPDDDDDSATAASSDEQIVGKSRKTLKRKRRATSPARFGAALEALLATSGPDGVAAPLSLQPGLARRQKEEKLERGARKVLDGERKEREETGRVRDIIGGWPLDGERALRKVAQRGVIALFNAVQLSQSADDQAAATARASRGTGKASLPAPAIDKSTTTASAAASQAEFLDIIRGGVVPSA